jgi:hypothetical protein
VKLFTNAVTRFREAIKKLLKSPSVAATKKILDRLLTVGVWVSIGCLVYVVWDISLIVTPLLFWFSLVGLLFFSFVFSSAETAFSMLEGNARSVAMEGKPGYSGGGKTLIQLWFDAQTRKQKKPSKFFEKRYFLIKQNVGEAFGELLTFLVVVNNVANLGGMYFIGRALITGDHRADRFSLVISSVIVVIVGEVTAKALANSFSVQIASCTVLFVWLLKPWLNWYTSRLAKPIDSVVDFIKKKTERELVG